MWGVHDYGSKTSQAKSIPTDVVAKLLQSPVCKIAAGLKELSLMSVRILITVLLIVGAAATSVSAAPLSAQAWPECKSLKPGARFDQAAVQLGGRGKRTGFALVGDLPVAYYAFRRAARTCRVQFEEGMVLAAPTLK